LITINDQEYFVTKIKENKEVKYVFFSKSLLDNQISIKQRKFKREIEKGNKLAQKAIKNKMINKVPSDFGWVELYPEIQRTLNGIENPCINGIEGFFILESSIDADPLEILKIYKQRDAAEKLIRNLKEGIEIRPIRHWKTSAIIGSILIAFLAESLINLTQLFCKNSIVKNVKLLKKYLINLTITFVYPKDKFRFSVVSNISPPISEFFGDFVLKYGTKNLNWRW